MAKYQKKVQEQVGRKGVEVKVFRVPREKNPEIDMVAKLAALGMVKMPMNVVVEVAEVPYTKCILVNAMEEKEDW